MYLTEYWNEDDDEDDVLVLPQIHEQLKNMIEFDKDNVEQETPNPAQ